MGQIIAIDSVVFIYVWNKQPEFFRQAKKVLEEISGGQTAGVFAQIGLIELLTGPKKLGRKSLAILYNERVKNFPNLEIRSLNDNVTEIASDLRAKYNLRTPDAIHVATAIDAGADRFITNDKTLKKVKEIAVTLL